MLGFVGFVLAVVVGIHLYLWKRLVRDTLRPGPWRKAGGFVALALALLVPATLILVRGGYVEWLAWPGYLWIALMFYLLVILVLLEIPRLIIRLVWRADRRSAGDPARQEAKVAAAGEQPVAATVRTGEPPSGGDGMDRRLLLARGAAIFAGLTAAGITGYGVRTALGGPRLDRYCWRGSVTSAAAKGVTGRARPGVMRLSASAPC